MGKTLAIHWAATTYGTWLHGDPRGSWRDGRLIGTDPYLEAESRARMNGNAVLLDAVERAIVADVFGQVVCEQRHRVLAATVQQTHTHLVLAPLREQIDSVVARLKRRSAAVVLARRRKSRDADETAGLGSIPTETAGPSSEPAKMAGLYSRAILARKDIVPRSLWTAGKFPVFVFDELHLANAIEYVRDHNRRVGLPADPFAWIEPLYPAADRETDRCRRTAICETLGW